MHLPSLSGSCITPELTFTQESFLCQHRKQRLSVSQYLAHALQSSHMDRALLRFCPRGIAAANLVCTLCSVFMCSGLRTVDCDAFPEDLHGMQQSKETD
jgi:hypothetical protein